MIQNLLTILGSFGKSDADRQYEAINFGTTVHFGEDAQYTFEVGDYDPGVIVDELRKNLFFELKNLDLSDLFNVEGGVNDTQVAQFLESLYSYRVLNSYYLSGAYDQYSRPIAEGAIRLALPGDSEELLKAEGFEISDIFTDKTHLAKQDAITIVKAISPISADYSL